APPTGRLRTKTWSIAIRMLRRDLGGSGWRRTSSRAWSRAHETATIERALVLLRGADAGSHREGLIAMAAQARKRLLIVATTTGYQTKMFRDVARRLGVEATLATDRCHVLDDPWGDHAIPVRFEAPEESAAALARERSVDAVVAIGDRPAYLAALAAEQLGVPFHSSRAAAAAINKFATRECFRKAGLLVPAYSRIPIDGNPEAAAEAIRYPCVLKPLGLSTSRGVIRANNSEEFIQAFIRVRALLKIPSIARLKDPALDYILVESFLPGREF